MGPFLIVFLALQLFYSTTLSKVLNVPINNKLNDYSALLPPELTDDNTNDLLEDEDDFVVLDEINEEEDLPVIQTFEDKTELKFHQPIESVNIDYMRNAIILKFHKLNAKSFMKSASIENNKSVQDNFMRFGKRAHEKYPTTNSLDENFIDKSHGARTERSEQTARDARGDNFMRFGRANNVNNDFMRFGRSVGKDFMRFGRSPTQDFMRFGRTPTQDFMRFGRTPSQDFMRFGRTPSHDNFMRFGRSSHDNFMRFGRFNIKLPKNTNFMRYSRPDNFMRFGRTPPQNVDNFMRFGKTIANSSDKNISQPLMNKNELKQAVKLIHEADKNSDNENPVDKAMKVLFDKHHQQDEISEEINNQHNDLDSDMDYFLKVSA